MVEVNTQANQLRQYTLAKQQVSEILHEGLQQFEKLKNESRQDQTRDLLVKLAEDRFNLAVVGQFKRGKSTLMNAVIGRDLLPTGVLPLTSAITTLCYGSQEKVVVKRTGWILDQEIPLTELPAYVTEQGNPGNAKGVIEVRIEMPSAFLRRGLYFIDTPGIGSTNQQNTATTLTFLPQADAVIFVTSVEAALSEPEEAFLREVNQVAHRLFVVLNKIDLLDPGEIAEVTGYIQAGVSKILGHENTRIFPISARTALNNRLNGDHGEDQSGMEAFKEALANFLAEEKSQLFLVSLLNRWTQIAEAGIQELNPDDPDVAAIRAILMDTRERANALRQSIQDGLDGLLESSSAATPPTSAPKEETPAMPVISKRAKIGKTRTCPICSGLSQTVFDFFAQYQSHLVQEKDLRERFAETNGFCQVHTWQFEQVASPLVISEGYINLIEKIHDALLVASQTPMPEALTATRQLLPDEEHCLACRLQRDEAKQLVERFLAFIQTADGKDYYQHSLGLCLDHLVAVLDTHPSPEVVQFLLEEQAAHFEEISEDIRGFILKRDAIRRHLLTGNEENAWRRVLVQIAGERTAYVRSSR